MGFEASGARTAVYGRAESRNWKRKKRITPLMLCMNGAPAVRGGVGQCNVEAEVGVAEEGREFGEAEGEEFQRGGAKGDVLDTPAVQV